MPASVTVAPLAAFHVVDFARSWAANPRAMATVDFVNFAALDREKSGADGNRQLRQLRSFCRPIDIASHPRFPAAADAR